MSIIRSLDLFSLPELFISIENDSKSGRLIVETPISGKTAKREGIYYLWFQNGYLIAISNCLNQKGLINLIAERGWISPPIVSRLRTLCPTGVPLGVYLHKMKLLNPEKLSLIFQLQLHQVYQLFQLTRGRFRFDDFSELQDRILTIPWLEMTGHRIKTSEACMYALRLMENSDNFIGQLPTLNQTLNRIVDRPHLKLTAIERQLYDRADNQTSLLNIAKITRLPVSIVQIVALRLITVGLLEAVVKPSFDWEIDSYQSKKAFKNDPEKKLLEHKTSLLDNLGGLFKRKV